MRTRRRLTRPHRSSSRTTRWSTRTASVSGTSSRVHPCWTVRDDMTRHRVPRFALLAGLAAVVLGVSQSAPASAANFWWLTNHYRTAYPTTEECARLTNGVYGSVWYTQNVAYV